MIKDKNTSRGFTLTELMVVVGIIAILATILYVKFADAQMSSRNGKRQADLVAISQALEAHKNPSYSSLYCSNGVNSYCTTQGSWFEGGSVPTDPKAGLYCIQSSGTLPSTPLTPMTASPDGKCSSGFSNISTYVFPNPSYTWVVCTNLEPWGTGGVSCRNSQQ